MTTTAFRQAVAKHGYKYKETQAGVDMYSRPEDALIHPDLFFDVVDQTVTAKSTVTGIEDIYKPEEILEMLPNFPLPE